MGSRPRLKPQRLAEKLFRIRDSFGLSQPEMLRRLGLEGVIAYNEISKYELGTREPSLLTLLQYARAAGLHVEDLIDDRTDLPAKLPGKVKHRA